VKIRYIPDLVLLLLLLLLLYASFSWPELLEVYHSSDLKNWIAM
jgi:hypothetical protein